MKNFRKITLFITSITVVLSLSIATQFLMAAWQAPTILPPGGNSGKPLTQTINDESKLGGLAIGNNFAVTGNSEMATTTFLTNIGVGTTLPQYIAPNSLQGNMDVNDIYLRSKSKWMSQLGGSNSGGAVDSYTKLLIHADGIDGSTSFTDSSYYTHTITANGNAKISVPATPKFSEAAYFDGSGDYLNIPYNSDWDFGTGDFTIDGWYRLTSTSDNQTFIQVGDYVNLLGLRIILNSNKWYVYIHGTLYSFTPNHFVNNWYHLALVRSGSMLKMYINGESVGSYTISTNFIANNKGVLIGAGQDDSPIINFFQGHIDELRISKGIARWNANFTPPSEPYSDTSSNSTDSSSVPNGTISAFNLSSCPTGWVAADGTNGTPDLRGMFIRGLNSFGSAAGSRTDGRQDPDGLRALDAYQADEFKTHRHQQQWTSTTNGLGTIGNSNSQSPVASGIYTLETGGNETRPKNVALIYCMKVSSETAQTSLWSQSGSDVYYNLGKVGIGTTNPASPLTVQSDGNINTLFVYNGASGYTGNILDIVQANTGSSGSYNFFRIYDNSNGVARFVIRGDGNVGIGIANPTQRLSVAGIIESTSGGIKFPDGSIQTKASSGRGQAVYQCPAAENINCVTYAPRCNSQLTTEYSYCYVGSDYDVDASWCGAALGYWPTRSCTLIGYLSQ